jgi:hypothetical protein
MKVAVLGGGPSGAFAAEKLAAAGVETIVIDEKLAWEKPCGGGLTWKAYSQYPFLTDSSTAKKVVTDSVLTAPGSAPARLKLDRPILIYSRYDLNSHVAGPRPKCGCATGADSRTGCGPDGRRVEDSHEERNDRCGFLHHGCGCAQSFAESSARN